MIFNSLGLTATHLRNRKGTLLHVPYRIASHGIVLFSHDQSVVVQMLPISAVEDSRFLPWLGLRGLYRIEDIFGSVARIGEGRVIDRIRRHRAAPMLLPGRVVAAFGGVGEWGYSERRYLEEAFANDWVREGNSLASHTYNRQMVAENQTRRDELNCVLSTILRLIRIGERVLDNDADEFFEVPPGDSVRWPSPPNNPYAEEDEILGNEVRLRQNRISVYASTFPSGTQLHYNDGRISALAVVRKADVILRPGSSVYLSSSHHVGRTFALQHRDFLEAAKVIGGWEFGITRIPVVALSAAFLIKNVTGGRVHNASRWRLA